jgi:hypothetical protein
MVSEKTVDNIPEFGGSGKSQNQPAVRQPKLSGVREVVF